MATMNRASKNKGNASTEVDKENMLNGQSSKSKQQKAEMPRIVDIEEQKHYVSMHVPGSGVRPFHFTQVFGQSKNQIEVYDATMKESVNAVLNGSNACVMCYGQTGEFKSQTKYFSHSI
jgi:hypothetical protein